MTQNRQFIIAGCGYIGKLLGQELIRQYPVSGLVSSEASARQCEKMGLNCVAVDFDNSEALQDINLDSSGKAVIYLAPPPRSGQNDTRLKNFLAAIEHKPPARFVLISTTGVYGDCGGRWVDEQTPVNPGVDRARRRADAEMQAQVFCKHHNIPLVILRVPGIYGPGKLPLARISKGDPVVCEEDSPFTNRIHAYDLVTICKTALTNEAIHGIYNCSDGHPGTMYEYFMKVADANHLPRPPAISLEQASRQLSPGMLSYMAESRRISNEKLLKDFALSLRYPDLDSGLRAPPIDAMDG